MREAPMEDDVTLLHRLVTLTDGRDDIGVCLVCCSGVEHEPDCAFVLARRRLGVTGPAWADYP